MAASYSCINGRFSVKCCAVTVEEKCLPRTKIRLGLPSEGRLADDTIKRLKDCRLSVKRVTPPQYVSEIPQLPNLEAWFQRPKDIVRNLVSGDLDIGFVGLDSFCEYGQGHEDLILVHDAINYLHCRLSLAIPKDGMFENINSLKELAEMPHWTPERPLRVATGFTYLGPKFLKEKGLKHVTFTVADGALEAAPALGIADAIIDIVGSGITLQRNNLKQIHGGLVLESQAVFVASRKSLLKRKGVLDITQEMIARLEARLRVVPQVEVTANVRASSQKDVTERIKSLSVLQGATISPVFGERDGIVFSDHYAISICVPSIDLEKSAQQLRTLGVNVIDFVPVHYIADEAYTFDIKSPRSRQLLKEIGL